MIKQDYRLGRADPRFFKEPPPYFTPYVEYGPSRSTLVASQPRREKPCPPKQATQAAERSSEGATGFWCGVVFVLFFLVVGNPCNPYR